MKLDSNVKYCLVVPHYFQALESFKNLLRRLPETGLSPLILVQNNDHKTRNLCSEYGWPVIDMPDFTWRHGLAGLRSFVREPVQVNRFCRRLFQNHRIEMLILVDDRRFVECFLVQEAKRREIPSLVLMWAATNTPDDMARWRLKSLRYVHSTWWRFLLPLVRFVVPQSTSKIEERLAFWQHPCAILMISLFSRYPKHPWVLGGGHADQVAVIGQHYREMLIAAGLDPARIVVTGHPYHDDFMSIDRDRTDYLLLVAPPISHIQQGTRAGHVTPAEMNQYLQDMLSQLLETGRRVVVRPHPRDWKLDLQYLTGHQKEVEISREGPLFPLISRSALVICQGTSAAFDACALDKPLLTFDYYETPGYDMWDRAGVSLHVVKPDQVRAAIEQICTDQTLQKQLQKARADFIDRYMNLDGQATDRILNLVANRVGSG